MTTNIEKGSREVLPRTVWLQTPECAKWLQSQTKNSSKIT